MLPNREDRRCPDDLSVMDLIQPDNSEPDRLLLVCTECGRWQVVVRSRERDSGRWQWKSEATIFESGPGAICTTGISGPIASNPDRAPYIAGVGPLNLDG